MGEREGLPLVFVICQEIAEMEGRAGLPESAVRCMEMEEVWRRQELS
jgi:hypothetical protein